MGSLSQNTENNGLPLQENIVNKTDIKSLNLNELGGFVLESGEPSFRVGQLFSWMHEKCVSSVDEMTNLSLGFREKIKENCTFTTLEKVECLESSLDGTRKYLFRLPDEEGTLKNNVIESVFMRYKHGNSVCISSQVGCRMGCSFCASTIGGLERNLTPAEMLEQVYRIKEDVGERISNVVIMGTGEPMDNLDNVLKFLELISCDKGQNISKRNITVSSCGLCDKLRAFADTEPDCTLAISLHAPNDTLRKQIMPVANRYSVEEVVAAADYYFEKTGRRITYEYSLINGVNDGREQAEELSRLLKGRNCHVNLIPVNPVKERAYKPATQQNVQSFKNILEKNHINATIRREMGSDINAACGQLRKSYSEKH
ncbi:MAG: 23S rRNA (adenine(2503)-C(2))-methyltransferase RlmN [Lachnospiraceae bacterium]|nr:23S rRNA (adenine(2503)-C(2))-methyltransferase RlmN [Lachnospiraceae bacterium]